jgi:hypothetical protein
MSTPYGFPDPYSGSNPGPVSYADPYSDGPQKQRRSPSPGSNMDDYPEDDDDSDNDDQGGTVLYPRPVKIEERRLPGTSSPPYCIQMQILDNYEWNPVPADDQGNPIRINVQETDPSQYPIPTSGDDEKYQMKRDPRTGLRRVGWERELNRRSVGSSCHCEWLSS